MVLVTEQDLLIEELRRANKELAKELRDAKAMLHRLSQYVSDEDFATIALEMTKETPIRTNSTEDFWRGE